MGASTRRFLVFIAVFALLILLSACGSADDTDAPKATLVPADASAIRQVDFSKVDPITTALRQFGGQLDVPAISYADLTADGREEAIVPIASGGTAGNVAYIVFTIRGGAPQPILTRTAERTLTGGFVMNAVDGKLVATAAEYGAEDPRCCPTSLRKTYFRWDGSTLQVEKEEVVPNPNAPKKE